MKRWKHGIVLGQSLCKLWPDEAEFWLKTAYCQHELRQTAAAKKTLQGAPAAVQKMPVCNYNLGCYEAQLGNVQAAKGFLKACFDQDKRFREEALADPDLQPVWDSLESL
jgi:hypothetical protein